MEEFNLRQIKDIIFENKIFIITILVLSLMIGMAYSFFFVIPEYQSIGKLLIEKNDTSMAEFVENNDIFKEVHDNVETNATLSELKQIVDVSYESSSRTITIKAVTTSSNVAKNIVNEFSNVLTAKIEEVYGYKNTKILQTATENANPININYIKDIGMFIIVGIVISGAYLFVILLKKSNVINDSINTENVLGYIPLDDKVQATKKDLVTNAYAKSITSDFFRKILTNIELNKCCTNPKTILITSTSVSEGKSFVAANLAVSLTKVGKKVLLIDADIVNGRQSKIFGIENELGFSDLLQKSTKLDLEQLQLNLYAKNTEIDNLDLVSSGKNNQESYELLMAGNLPKLIQILNCIYDIIIFDGIASLDLTDSVILSKYVDTTVVVTEYDKTKILDLKNTKINIEKVGGKVLGIIINKAPKYHEEYKSLVKYKKKLSNKMKQ